jgi:carbonic anhydrase
MKSPCRHRPPSSIPASCRLACALFLTGLPPYGMNPAEAATWVTVIPENKAKVEVDTASIERSSDGKIRVWHRETYSPKRLQEAWAFSYGSLKQLSELTCDKRLLAPLRKIYFSETGSELKSQGFDAKDATPVVPESPGEAVFNHACKKKTSPPVEPPKPIPPPPPPPPEKGKGGKSRSSSEEAPPPPPPKIPAQWSHEGSKLGPSEWGKLDSDYAACANGKRQSPIDIREAIRSDLPPLRIAYQPVPLNILDDGHGIQVNTSGAGTITIEGDAFELQSFRFRHPGEEMVNGKRAAMSVQLEHRAKSGQVAILAVPLQEGKTEHRLIRTLWSALPLEQGKQAAPAGIKIDPGQLLPAKREYYTYSGSLTTPPCSEGVLWLVMKQPVVLSKEQIADFSRLYKNNSRPIQPSNRRVIKESR